MTFTGASCYTWLPSGGHRRYCSTKVQRKLFPYYYYVVLTIVVASSKPQHMGKDGIFSRYIRVLQDITNKSNS